VELTEERTDHGWRVSLREDGQALSWCSVVERTIRVGSSQMLIGGIGGVGTRREHRHRGYSRRVMEAAVALMGRERYPLSLLHGIQDFYGKFGYVTCMPEYELWLDTRDAELASSSLRTRRLRAGDMPAAVAMYNRDNAERVGSAVRELGRWRGFAIGTWWTIPAQVQVVLDGDSQIAGYVVVDDTREACRAAEAGGQGEAVYAALLQHLARRAVRLRRQRIGMFLPDDHPFAMYCRQFGLRANTLFPRAEKSMGRIIDLDQCMQALCAELSRRWPADNRSAALGFRTELGGGTLRYRDGRALWAPGRPRGGVQLPQQALTQLLLGYVRASDLENWGGLVVPPSSRRLMTALFPLAQAQLWWADRF
jgi:predicted acetyltransferase